MVKSGFWTAARAVFLVCIATAIVSPAQLVQLYMFQGDGPPSQAAVIQGFDGYLYGTTDWKGEVFKLPKEQFATDTILYFFCSQPNCTDGTNPFGALVQTTDGNFYGTTTAGGSNGCNAGCGTVFEITPGGTLTTLYRFSGPDGATPIAGLIQASDGSFYGTAYAGGANSVGTIFNITSAGTLTVLYNFCAKPSCADGANPRGALVQGTDGSFYGTTSAGGTGNVGTVFKITSGGTLTTLHTFSGADGAYPFAGLIQASDGKFYGTTYAGGTYGLGAIFNITSGGTLTTLHSFCAQGLPWCLDGANPYGGLVQSVHGYFFGTTYTGGTTYKNTPAAGTIFEYVPSDGSVAAEYSFCSAGGCADGEYPAAGLIEGTDGNLYGTTEGGGVGLGTVFSLWSGDSPFVKTNPISGRVGSTIGVLGQGFTGTKKVVFGGVAAAYTVASDTYLTATMPSGAKTGTVTVTTLAGTLKSGTKFRVLPSITSFKPTSGPVGTAVVITGVSITQTSKVTFGGVKSATVTVNSDTQVTATVPSSAKTGKIVITTAGGSATSSGTFTVTP